MSELSHYDDTGKVRMVAGSLFKEGRVRYA